MEAASTASEARRFGKYTLVAKLATGGMAEIFLARLHGDGGFEKLVCIKRILPHLAKDSQFVAMFLDEARVAARISHPNVCQVFELGEWQGQYYIAMEYLEGVPLSVFRRKDFYPMPPDPRLVAGFGVQACEGLHHAHQLKRPDGELLGVVHRDISPQNLFATIDGIVKVLDFGIAKVQDASVRTSTGAVKGTYAYMAPEQLRNETLDRRSDVWAIGTVLWETLAQRHLFKRETEFLTFEAITKLPIPDICEVRPDVPPLLGDVLARALARNAEDRFSSARALGEALGQAVAPLGGVLTSPAIAEEVEASFEATLAEQRMLLRIAREGGQFDLESSSPLGPHGTAISNTPVSNIQQRVEEARAEVAHFVAATQAIESLEDDDSVSRPPRFGTDGAFTPAPSRRSSLQQAAMPDPTPTPAPQRRSSPMPAQRRSQPYNVAPREWRYDETEPPIPAPHTSSMPVASVKSSKLPWLIAIIAMLAAAASGLLLYQKLKEKPAVKASEPEQQVVMKDETAAAASSTPTPVTNAPGSATKDQVDAVKEPEKEPVKEPVKEPEQEPTKEPEKVAAKDEKEPEKVVAVTIKKPTKGGKGGKQPKKQPEKIVVEKPAEKPVEKVAEKPPDKPIAGPPGMITIDSTPVYAVIYIDNKKYGETPLVNIKLAPGKHTVRAVSPSGSTKTLTINIEAGKTAPVRRISW